VNPPHHRRPSSRGRFESAANIPVEASVPLTLYPRRSVAPAPLRASDSSVSERDALAEATFIDGDLDDPAAHLDLIEQFEPIHDLAKHGVTAIEMGCG